MVQLKLLNKSCKQNLVSKAIPAQFACRLLGSSLTPCQLNALCKQCNKRGVWVFYSAFILAAAAAFVLIYWVLRITRLNKILSPLSQIVVQPAKWLTQCGSAIVYFFKNLPF